MTFSFHDLRKEVLENVVLSTDFFAESGATIDYGDGRLVELTIKVRRRAAADLQQETHKETDTIEVVINRDPDSETGGIDRPRTGMRLLRSADRDPDRGPYVFLGEVVDETPHRYVLVFQRVKTKAHGRGTR